MWLQSCYRTGPMGDSLRKRVLDLHIVSCFNCSWRNQSQLFTFALVWRCMSENGYGHNRNKVLPSVSVETDSFWGVVRKGLLSRWGGGLQHWTFHGAQDAEGANNKVLGHPDYVCIKTLDLSKERSSRVHQYQCSPYQEYQSPCG